MMKTYSADKNLGDFIQAVAKSKKNINNRLFLHIALAKGPDAKLFDEVEQFLHFQLNVDEPHLLKIEAAGSFLLFLPKKYQMALNQLEKAALDKFGHDALHILKGDFENDGMPQFFGILQKHIPQDDTASQIGAKRMQRLSNCIMILDDDLMVVRQMEKILTNFGTVISLLAANDFEDNYNQYAPDILFLDIHLNPEKGNELLKTLKREIDPFAHVVMISGDTKQGLVLDIKDGGASGFAVKPIIRDKILQQLMRAPTIIPKNS